MNPLPDNTGIIVRPDPRRLAYDLGRAFAERVALEDLIPFAIDTCRQVLDAEGVGLLFVDSERGELYFPYASDADTAVRARLLSVRFPANRGFAGTVLRWRTALRADDVSTDPRFFGGVDQYTGRTTRALLCAPLASHQGMIGVIEAVNPHGRETFSDDDLTLFDALAHSLGEAINKARCTADERKRSVSWGPEESGLQAARSSESATQPLPSEAVFRKEGDYWTVLFEGHIARLKDAKGLHYIAHLLRHPGQEFHARDLAALVGHAPLDVLRTAPGSRDRQLPARAGLGHAGELLDAPAKAAYKHRLDELRAELEDAERCNDPGRATHAREEIAVIRQQLTAAVGLGGRDRVAASDAERARLAVTKRIKAALNKIGAADPALARHLSNTITTGYFCAYAMMCTPASWSL